MESESVHISTLAGRGDCNSVNGIGLEASFAGPVAICASPAGDELLIPEARSFRVRSVFPISAQRKASVEAAVVAVLLRNCPRVCFGTVRPRPLPRLRMVPLPVLVTGYWLPVLVRRADSSELKRVLLFGVWCLVFAVDKVTTICGSDRGFKHGKCLGEGALMTPSLICIDPLNPTCY